MILNQENYHSVEANKFYLSNSQYHNFLECENKAMARLLGLYEEPSSTALLQGQYVDSWNDQTLDQFIAKHPEMFSTRGATAGELKSEYKKCNEVIEVIKNDEMFMASLQGDKQRIFTAELFGVPWKIKIDSYFERTAETNGRIVDLKVLKSLYDKFWDDDAKAYLNVFEFRGYFDQISIYSKIEQLASGRPDNDYYEPYLAVATKEDPPDKSIVSFSAYDDYVEFINSRLIVIEQNIDRIIAVKTFKEQPNRCDKCDYCRATKRLTSTTHFSQYNLY